MNRRRLFDLMYRFDKPAWDTGITPPEVAAMIDSGVVCGRALDVGCGTGTNALYLAQRGLTVVGVDFSPQAIALAREKAERARVAVDFHVADVTRLDSLDIREPFDFVLDMGCLHSIAAAARAIRGSAGAADASRECVDAAHLSPAAHVVLAGGHDRRGCATNPRAAFCADARRARYRSRPGDRVVLVHPSLILRLPHEEA